LCLFSDGDHPISLRDKRRHAWLECCGRPHCGLPKRACGHVRRPPALVPLALSVSHGECVHTLALGRSYNIRGERRDVSFALFSEISDNTVTMCAIGEQGLATINSVEDGVLQLVIVADLEDPDPVVVERVPLVSAFPPTCIGIVEPRVRVGEWCSPWVACLASCAHGGCVSVHPRRRYGGLDRHRRLLLVGSHGGRWSGGSRAE